MGKRSLPSPVARRPNENIGEKEELVQHSSRFLRGIPKMDLSIPSWFYFFQHILVLRPLYRRIRYWTHIIRYLSRNSLSAYRKLFNCLWRFRFFFFFFLRLFLQAAAILNEPKSHDLQPFQRENLHIAIYTLHEITLRTRRYSFDYIICKRRVLCNIVKRFFQPADLKEINYQKFIMGRKLCH